MDLGKLIGAVFIKLKKAFNTVHHNILCQKLEYYGIGGRYLAWFRSYLSIRKQLTGPLVIAVISLLKRLSCINMVDIIIIID